MGNRFFLTSIFVLVLTTVSWSQPERLKGHWKGVKMAQNASIYSGAKFFLPNDGEMILTENSIKMYYYPFFKSIEFKVRYAKQSIYYSINNREIRNEYYFSGDTLIFKMRYVDKEFLKMFVPIDMDEEIVKELDDYGYRTNKLIYEFELDTFHRDQRNGFEEYDSLQFTLLKHLKFNPNNKLMVNQTQEVTYSRSFKRFQFDYQNQPYEFEILHLGGTQDILLIPVEQCQCDSITIPYMTVSWADRIRQAIIDEENF